MEKQMDTQINNINDKYSVVFSDRLESLNSAWGGFTVEELDATDIFINGNYPNTSSDSREEFSSLVVHDSINKEAQPVLVYLNGDIMTGWYDEELQEGFIPEALVKDEVSNERI
jgi:hypothetical protein